MPNILVSKLIDLVKNKNGPELNKLISKLQNTPQSQAGIINRNTVEDYASVTFSKSPLIPLEHQIKSLSGFNLQELQCLMHDSRGHYYPTLSVQEIQDRKLLKTIEYPDEKEWFRKGLINQLGREHLTSLYGNGVLKRLPAIENKILENNESSVLKGRPSMVCELIDKSIAIIDIEDGDSKASTDISRDIAMNHYALMAQSCGIDNPILLSVKVNIDRQFCESLQSLQSALGKNFNGSIVRPLAKSINNENILTADVIPVNINADLQQEIKNIAGLSWTKILNNEPLLSKANPIEPAVKLTDEVRRELEKDCTEYLVAKSIEGLAKQKAIDTKKSITEMCKENHITENYQPVFSGTAIRKSTTYNFEGIASYLEQKGVDSKLIRQKTIDTDSLIIAAESEGVNVSSYTTYTTPDAGAIKEVCVQLGVNMDDFISDKSMDVYTATKTRGPIHDGLLTVREMCKDTLEQNINELADSIEVEQPFETNMLQRGMTYD